MDRVRTTNDRNFWAGFTAAAVLHAALIFAASSSTPRQLGESDGLQDAISVELVEPETLAGAGPHEGEPSTEPASDSRPLQLPRQATDAWQTSGVPDKPDQPQAAAREAKPEQQAMLALPDPDAAKVEEPQEASKEPQKPNEAHKEQKQQKETHKSGAPKSPTTKEKLASPQLDFSLPSNFSLPSGGGGASAVMRPSGITRSGENDEFGRDVVKALRKTMPAHEKIFGRVTVRILLSEKGDLIDLQLLKGSGSSYLDQVVMFSARQAVYPFPPKGSTAIDRTFVITYIYS